MIVTGSYAAMLNGVQMRQSIKDIDVVGSAVELEKFRSDNAEHILSEKSVGTHRMHFHTRSPDGAARIEFDFEQSDSDRQLAAMSQGNTTRILGSSFHYPSINALYFIKRAHANNPVMFDKTARDLLRLKKYVTDATDEELAFYRTRKKECQDRFASNRQRFQLSVSNEDFFALSDHIRTFVHDDVHEAVAHTKGQPIYLRCKRDRSKAKIETGMFEELDLQDRLRMVQEEFMVIGLERYYVPDNSLSAYEVYMRGMHKTIRDLFVGYFQDFCIDHLDRLQEPPDFNFVKRFDDGVASGEIRMLPNKILPAGAKHKAAWAMVKEGRLNEARAASEDLVRQAEPPGDPHAFHILGVVMARTRKLATAEKCFRQSLSIQPRNPQCWVHLGLLLREQDKATEAVDCFNRALKMSPNTPESHVNLGLAYEKLGNREAAVEAYRTALRLKPGAALAQQRLNAIG